MSTSIYNISSKPEISNNTVNGGYGDQSSTCILNNSSPATIMNNVLNAGGAEDGGSSPYSKPLIRNNVIFTEGGGTQWGICEKDDVSEPESVRNNTIFNCPDALYRDEDSVSITAVDQNMTTGEGTQTLEYWGNISEGNTGMFIDFSGGDWHLAGTTPLNIRGGGRTISGITSDKDGIGRTTSTPTGMTNAGAAGWSMGAHEKD
ncbi:MAG: hypothetical protein JXB88_14770 [Spirochaetales bacterium]|nr:hypothetical protein [Spirochaetales bacterium]